MRQIKYLVPNIPIQKENALKVLIFSLKDYLNVHYNQFKGRLVLNSIVYKQLGQQLCT